MKTSSLVGREIQAAGYRGVGAMNTKRNKFKKWGARYEREGEECL